MTETTDSDPISPRLQRIATIAEAHPDEPLTPLAHFIDEAWLYEAFRRTRKDGAPGVDGQTATDYARNLPDNIRSLLDRAKSGSYWAPPVRRAEIPKGDGNETRTLGIPTFEDKVLQRAVAMVLEAVYEREFHGGSFGFRPGRSAHQALQATWQSLMCMGVGLVLEIDIRKFFDEVDHAQLRAILRKRVGDGDILRLINKWLKAGALGEGASQRLRKGTPQGGVISPILANIFLHEVLDQWFETEVKPRLRGEAHLVRFADDAVLLLKREDDARRVMEVLPKRFGKYGLRLHPEKTRLVPFKSPEREVSGPKKKPASFDLLGFTHYWGRSLSGNWIVKRKTAKDRKCRILKAFNEWCRTNRHRSIPEQWRALSRKLRGLYAYYGIIGNVKSLRGLWFRICQIWRKWLNRRSQRGRMPWPRFRQMLRAFPLPMPTRMIQA
jgi:group II intron reverse transcriptase/maturase